MRRHLRPKYRRALYALIGAYLAWALIVGFWPSPVDRPVHTQIQAAIDTLHAHGVARSVNYPLVEFTANIWFFVPIGLLLGVLLTGRFWWVAVLGGASFSAIIELGQLLFRPERVASWFDIAANTLGTVGGVLVISVIHEISSAVRRRRP